MSSKVVQFDKVEIATETFGDPNNEPVLLIMGAMASMLWWPDAFCEQLAGAGRYVIRYDNRDTGLSTHYEPGKPGYELGELAEDAAQVLDAYGLSSAHIVGMSMGGMLAQLLALKHPDRVRSLTIISTSPVGVDTSSLPGMTPEYAEHSAKGESVDWSDRKQVIDFVVADMAAIASTKHPHDPVAARAHVERDYDRAKNFQSVVNHFMAVDSSKSQPSLADLKVPLLVMHGTSDPLISYPHGEASAAAVAGARLVTIEGGGHEVHEDDWPQFVGEIVAQTGR